MPPTSTLREIGFPDPIEVSGLRSIAHIFGSSKSRCGIYLLCLPDDRCYIGQAVDVARRFAQHLKTHERIERFSFLAVRPSRLDAREKEMIFRAETAKMVLTNVIHVADVTGESDLEQLIAPPILERWLTNPQAQNRHDVGTIPIQLPLGQEARFEGKLQRLQQHPLHRVAVAQLYLYLEATVPYPRLTEYSFWSVSCMPSTNQQYWPRLLCVSASVMELFCLGYYKDPELRGVSWGFVNVASDVLFRAFGGQAEFSAAFPEVEVLKSTYRDGGQHQVTICTSTQNDMTALLNDEAVTAAAATLCMRLMRKRSTIYFKFHCPQLVNAAMRLRDSTAKEVRTELAAT